MWAPAVLRTAVDSIKLIVVPDAALTTSSLLLAGTGIVVPLVAFVVLRYAPRGRGDQPLPRRGGPAPLVAP